MYSRESSKSIYILSIGSALVFDSNKNLIGSKMVNPGRKYCAEVRSSYLESCCAM